MRDVGGRYWEGEIESIFLESDDEKQWHDRKGARSRGAENKINRFF